MNSYQNQLMAAGIGESGPSGYNRGLNPLGAFIGGIGTPQMLDPNAQG